ncbi:unnamed protein product [Paramecium pentaurelia]|uniref:Uncharacterized protein n=1 Tax=Paramecium pentaurelia TaxID=43138 RepID=A0A8S1W6V8_9CILI|nr:unnamed protein product [Paramecium pentaurelia]
MAQAQALAGENYEFKAAPEVIKPKPKYRQQPLQSSEDQKNSSLLGCNIMYDKRVVRGNTYASVQTQGDKKLMTLKSFKKPQQKATQQPQTTYLHPSTPRPFQNRVNIDIQTDEYLEILTDKPPEQEMDAQTDYYIDKPPDRLFVPKKNGIDKETQIWEGDLFDFDQEVEPILQVLMNKILEQSRMEVLEEEEIKLMKEQQKQHERQKTSVLSEMQRLEAVQQRLDQEDARRKLQYETFLKIQKQSHQKIVCRNLSKSLINPLKQNIIKKLQDLGVFRDPLETALLYEYIPWVYDNVLSQLVDENDNSTNFNNMLNNIEENITIEHSNSLKRRQQHIDDKYEEIARKKREKIEKKRMEEERRLKEIEDQRLAEEEAVRQAEQEKLDQQQENQQQQQFQS